jgi:hypothetical protein
VLPVGKDLVLPRQEGTAGIHQVDARQVVLLRDLLRAQVLLHRHRVIGAALHGGVVGDHHAVHALDAADAGDHAGRRRFAVVHAVRGELANLEERCAGVEQLRHAVARQQLAARGVAFTRPAPPPSAAFSTCRRRSATVLRNCSALRRNSSLRGMIWLWMTCMVLTLAQAVSENSSRPISMRRISLVPAPIS